MDAACGPRLRCVTVTREPGPRDTGDVAVLDTRHLIAYALIVILLGAFVALVMRARYLSPAAVEKRRRAREREERHNR